ncbi:hypothetical protein FGO68_gene3875 [Halteria grandinella]|uniref:Uncharacterized protein n=1 Tax=Halteria grandinella TaxID=5974 RepID=A0A8J8NJ16_HALGN|nr:hypothetical protein FGO68_gene3875 [Halteria grandinella]
MINLKADLNYNSIQNLFRACLTNSITLAALLETALHIRALYHIQKAQLEQDFLSSIIVAAFNCNYSTNDLLSSAIQFEVKIKLSVNGKFTNSHSARHHAGSMNMLALK